MRRYVKSAVVVGLLAAGGYALNAWLLAPDPIPVRVAVAARGRVEQTVTNTRAGTVRARRRAKLSPEYGGRVMALPFREGERVAKGQVLLKLDDQIERAELQLAERDQETTLARREEACLAAERAQRELERTRRLAEDQIASQDLLDQAATEARRAAAACEAARSSVERARAAVRLARARVEKTVLLAPFDGVIAELDAEVGEWVTPSPPALPVPPVIDILDPTSLYVSAPMDEVDSARIEVGFPARVTVDSFPGKHFSGRVARVAPYVLDVEEQNRTVEIEVNLERTEVTERLLPGTSADVEVILEAREDVLRVPTPAIVQGRLVLGIEDQTLVERSIETGLSNWDFTEVMSGLEAGERVVVSLDRTDVRAGALVTVEAEEGAP